VWVPVAVFAFLFGLSMDYEVFILARMREAYDATGSTTTAIITGIGRTGRLVTSAALILFLAFVSLAANPEVNIKILATGLGAGILVDALVIRSVLVPAFVALLGSWNWYLPTWMAHALRVEALLPPPLYHHDGDHRPADHQGRRRRAASVVNHPVSTRHGAHRTFDRVVRGRRGGSTPQSGVPTRGGTGSPPERGGGGVGPLRGAVDLPDVDVWSWRERLTGAFLHTNAAGSATLDVVSDRPPSTDRRGA
jgi:hypothetical protein